MFFKFICDLAVLCKRNKNGANADYVDINAVINCANFISHKWELIGMMLHLSDSTINQIAERTKSKNLHEDDYQKSCCVSMLTEWLKQNTNATTTDFVSVLEYPAVALSCEVVEKVKSIVQRKSKYTQKDLMVVFPPACKPDRIQVEFMKMLSYVIELLNDSGKKLTEAINSLSLLINYDNTPMLDSALLNDICSWKKLIDRFIEGRLCTLFDVEWLIILTEDIVDCPRAAEKIKEYKEKTRNAFLTNKILWERSPDDSINGIIQVKTENSCQNVTIEDYNRSKIATAAVLRSSKHDLIPLSCTESSVSYNWMVSLKLVSRLQLPNSITESVENMCTFAKITQISILRAGQTDTLILSHLSVTKGMYVCT